MLTTISPGLFNLWFTYSNRAERTSGAQQDHGSATPCMWVHAYASMHELMSARAVAVLWANPILLDCRQGKASRCQWRRGSLHSIDLPTQDRASPVYWNERGTWHLTHACAAPWALGSRIVCWCACSGLSACLDTLEQYLSNCSTCTSYLARHTVRLDSQSIQ